MANSDSSKQYPDQVMESYADDAKARRTLPVEGDGTLSSAKLEERFRIEYDLLTQILVQLKVLNKQMEYITGMAVEEEVFQES